nr:hypothetical protein RTCK_00255 [Rhizobium sp. TCK]
MLIDTSPPPQSGRAHSTIATTASDVSGYLDEGSAPWLSHLVINGIHLSMNISAGKVDLSSDNDDPDHLAFARWKCTAATDKLAKLGRPVTSQLDADIIRLGDRSVQRQVDLLGFIDICRRTVLLLVMFEPIRLGTLSGLMVEATPGLLGASCHPGTFAGPLWVPIQIEMYRPSIFIEAPRLNAPSPNYPSLMRRLQTEAEPGLIPWAGPTGLSWMRSATMIDQSIAAACRLLVPSNVSHDHVLIRGIDQSLLPPSSESLLPTGRSPIPGETPFTGGRNE